MDNFNYGIIVPYRDKYELLLMAIDSIPDREDIQIIIVDNSKQPLSGDRIPVKKYSKILFTRSSSTKGAGFARNTGLSLIDSKFVIFLDADDYFTHNAFKSFDKYLDKDYDIVFFEADSIRLKDGTHSTRHEKICQYVQTFLKYGDEGPLRYQYVNPVAKMIRMDLIYNHNIRFEEVKVSNDAMFSVLSGHYANRITACSDVVYMITEGERGSSLTQSSNVENQFTRFQVSVRRFKFITAIGQKKYRPKLSGSLRHVLFKYGFKEFVRYIRYAKENGLHFFSLFM